MSQRSVNLFLAVDFLYWSSMYLYVPILAVQARDLGASMGLIGLIVGSYGLAQLMLRFPLGKRTAQARSEFVSWTCGRPPAGPQFPLPWLPGCARCLGRKMGPVIRSQEGSDPGPTFDPKPPSI